MNTRESSFLKGSGKNRKSRFVCLAVTVLTFMSSTFSLPATAFTESCQVEKVIGATVDNDTYYHIQVKWEAQNLYKVEGQNIWIKTQMCAHFQSLYPEDAILKIDSAYSYNIGELHFLQ